MRYSLQERREILEIYLECNKNRKAAQRLYRERHPHVFIPALNTFKHIYQKFQETNILQDKKKRRQNNVLTQEVSLNISYS